MTNKTDDFDDDTLYIVNQIRLLKQLISLFPCDLKTNKDNPLEDKRDTVFELYILVDHLYKTTSDTRKCLKEILTYEEYSSIPLRN